MTPKLKKLKETVFLPDGEIRKRYDGQLDEIREAFSAYRLEYELSWWKRFKKLFEPHFEVTELPPYQHIKMLLLETPEDKKVELINKLIGDGEHHFLLNNLTPETIEKIIEIGEDKMWGEK